MKEENAMQAEFKKHLLEEKQRRESQAVIQKRLMDKKQDEASQLEMHRLRQLQDSKELQEQLENLRYTDVLRYHEQKIRTLKGRTEYLEIIRREEEEQRMRYLEGRRKMIEDRIASKIAQEEADKLAAIKHTADIRILKIMDLPFPGCLIAELLSYTAAAAVDFFFGNLSTLSFSSSSSLSLGSSSTRGSSGLIADFATAKTIIQ